MKTGRLCERSRVGDRFEEAKIPLRDGEYSRATVVRASIDRPVLAKALTLRAITVAQSVGYPKK